jgi:D-glycero-D-manno-heptose 1,7-bisphosphate phosphatase
MIKPTSRAPQAAAIDGPGRPAAFLDRDGTINRRPAAHAYVETVDGFVWLPGALEGASALAHAGFVLAVVSNQRGIARGLVSWPTLAGIEREIQRRLRERDSEIAAFRYCPHELGDGCDCRKPAPGMILELARVLRLDLRRSWMIGDSASDIFAGQAAGCLTALIEDGGSPPQPDLRPDIVAPSLQAAVAAILDRAPAPTVIPA